LDKTNAVWVFEGNNFVIKNNSSNFVIGVGLYVIIADVLVLNFSDQYKYAFIYSIQGQNLILKNEENEHLMYSTTLQKR
jgi:hypothetical protein